MRPMNGRKINFYYIIILYYYYIIFFDSPACPPRRSYGGKKLERARDLFEQALNDAPPEASRPLFMEVGAARVG